VASRGSHLRVRWDRVGRVGLLLVLAIVVGLYVKQGLSLLSTHSQAEQQLAIVRHLRHDNARLARERNGLNDPATIEREARALGMVRPGERPYVVTGLGSH
jgi:cell division protein FtsB